MNGFESKEVKKTKIPSELPECPDKLLKLSGGTGSKDSSSHESEAEASRKPSEREDESGNGFQEKEGEKGKEAKRGGLKDSSSHESEAKASLKPSEREDESSNGSNFQWESGSQFNDRKPRSRERTHDSYRKKDKKNRDDEKVKDKKQDKEREHDRKYRTRKSRDYDSDRRDVKKDTVIPSKFRGSPDKLSKLNEGGPKVSPSHESKAGVKRKVRDDDGETENGSQRKMEENPKGSKDKKLKLHKSSSSRTEKDRGNYSSDKRKRTPEPWNKFSDERERKRRNRWPTHDSYRVQNMEKVKDRDQEKKDEDKKRIMEAQRNLKHDWIKTQALTRCFSSLPMKSDPGTTLEKALCRPRYQSEFMRMVFRDTDPDFIESLHFRPKQRKSSNRTEPNLDRPKVLATAATAPEQERQSEANLKKRKFSPDADKDVLPSQAQTPKKTKLELNGDSAVTEKKQVQKKCNVNPTLDKGIAMSVSQTLKNLMPVPRKKRARSNSLDSAYDSDCFEKRQDKKKARRESHSLKALHEIQFEKARELSKKIGDIREKYKLDLESKHMRIRQRAVAMYFIDKLGFGVGNDKDEDMPDSVGCCSLLYEHIKLHEEKEGNKYVLVFDHVTKKSARYQNEVSVDKTVFKSLKIFLKEKKAGDALFDWLESASLKKYLGGKMEGLTAKVMRTFNASQELQKKLDEMTTEGKVADKISAYNRAVQAVTKICNKQPTEEKSTAATKIGKAKAVPLEAFKLNYMDPRITLAWCLKYDVPIETIYTEVQRSNFKWAITETDKSFRFK